MKCTGCSGTGESLNEGQSCFECGGTGELCDVCGESTNACLCEDDDEDEDDDFEDDGGLDL